MSLEMSLMFHSTASSVVTKSTPSLCQELEWKFYACIEHVLLRQKLPIQTNLFHVSLFAAWGGKGGKGLYARNPASHWLF